MTAAEMRGARLEAPIRDEVAMLSDGLAGAGRPVPALATVLVGDDPAAASYRASITRSFRRVGVAHRAIDLPAGTSTADVVATVRRLNADAEVTGIMVFLPLPGRQDDLPIREAISPLKDVDGVSPLSAGYLRLGRPTLEPACPRAGVALLQAHGVTLAGSRVTVVGRSPVVGGPLATMLVAADATVTTCHRRTRDLAGATLSADVVACAAGVAGLLTGDMVHEGATVLDFGTNVADGHLVGDTAPGVRERAGLLSPVPGGTGPATALVLAYQTVLAGLAVAAGSLDGILAAPTVETVARRAHVLSAVPS
jgi:methylenetetrahydrofolate dehydrogenase (NADP+) / methenyltetrahydrofolate cyclohydrolase